MSSFFKVLHRSKKSHARVGEIHTSHGTIKTPAFVPVATKGTIKATPPEYIKEIGIQVAFVNAYHLVNHPGVDVLEKAGGIQKFSKLEIPLMSDSAGFQVFSLAVGQRLRRAELRDGEQALVQKITPDGVIFRSVYDGSIIEFTPEKSIRYQQKIGADMIMAFDECTYHPATHEYAEKAMQRTHNWLLRCIQEHKKRTGHPQYLYGIVQGGQYEDLRKKSAEFVTAQDTEGVAIGGVSVGEGKLEMRKQVQWVADFLPKDKPVHLLGIGQIDDILDTVHYGIDSFDCVEPTRLARMGGVYQMSQVLRVKEELAAGRTVSSGFYKEDFLKTKYKSDLSSLDENCTCYVCQNFSKAFIHHLYRGKELLVYTLASYHNLFVMEMFMETIRQLIQNDLI